MPEPHIVWYGETSSAGQQQSITIPPLAVSEYAILMWSISTNVLSGNGLGFGRYTRFVDDNTVAWSPTATYEVDPTATFSLAGAAVCAYRTDLGEALQLGGTLEYFWGGNPAVNNKFARMSAVVIDLELPTEAKPKITETTWSGSPDPLVNLPPVRGYGTEFEVMVMSTAEETTMGVPPGIWEAEYSDTSDGASQHWFSETLPTRDVTDNGTVGNPTGSRNAQFLWVPSNSGAQTWLTLTLRINPVIQPAPDMCAFTTDDWTADDGASINNGSQYLQLPGSAISTPYNAHTNETVGATLVGGTSFLMKERPLATVGNPFMWRLFYDGDFTAQIVISWNGDTSVSGSSITVIETTPWGDVINHGSYLGYMYDWWDRWWRFSTSLVVSTGVMTLSFVLDTNGFGAFETPVSWNAATYDTNRWIIAAQSEIISLEPDSGGRIDYFNDCGPLVTIPCIEFDNDDYLNYLVLYSEDLAEDVVFDGKMHINGYFVESLTNRIIGDGLPFEVLVDEFPSGTSWSVEIGFDALETTGPNELNFLYINFYRSAGVDRLYFESWWDDFGDGYTDDSVLSYSLDDAKAIRIRDTVAGIVFETSPTGAEGTYTVRVTLTDVHSVQKYYWWLYGDDTLIVESMGNCQPSLMQFVNWIQDRR